MDPKLDTTLLRLMIRPTRWSVSIPIPLSNCQTANGIPPSSRKHTSQAGAAPPPIMPPRQSYQRPDTRQPASHACPSSKIMPIIPTKAYRHAAPEVCRPRAVERLVGGRLRAEFGVACRCLITTMRGVGRGPLARPAPNSSKQCPGISPVADRCSAPRSSCPSLRRKVVKLRSGFAEHRSVLVTALVIGILF